MEHEPPAAPGGRSQSTLDLVCSVMDLPARPLDFTLILRSTSTMQFDRLRAGARSAQNLFPVTGCCVQGSRWVRQAVSTAPVVEQRAASESDERLLLESFIDRPFDLRRDAPVRQLLVASGSRSVLATRFHHAAADGLSAALWLGHELGVASGQVAAVTQPAGYAPPRLRGDGSARGRVARQLPSARLSLRDAVPTRTRRWLTVDIAADDLRRRVRALRQFTYSDLLTTVALDVLWQWNHARGGDEHRLGVWLPVNIRRSGSREFGNGTSRLQIHRCEPWDGSFAARCRHTHEQIARGMQRREWAVPESAVLRALPLWPVTWLLRAYLRRPSADIGSAAFSHVEQREESQLAFLNDVDRIDTVSSLHARHGVSMVGVTWRGRTWLTLTWDPALVSDAEANEFVGLFVQSLDEARRGLACAG